MVAKVTAFLSVARAAPALAAAPAMVQTANAAGRGKAALSVRGKFIDQRVAEFMEKNDVPGLHARHDGRARQSDRRTVNVYDY